MYNLKDGNEFLHIYYLCIHIVFFSFIKSSHLATASIALKKRNFVNIGK